MGITGNTKHRKIKVWGIHSSFNLPLLGLYTSGLGAWIGLKSHDVSCRIVLDSYGNELTNYFKTPTEDWSFKPLHNLGQKEIRIISRMSLNFPTKQPKVSRKNSTKRKPWFRQRGPAKTRGNPMLMGPTDCIDQWHCKVPPRYRRPLAMESRRKWPWFGLDTPHALWRSRVYLGDPTDGSNQMSSFNKNMCVFY